MAGKALKAKQLNDTLEVVVKKFHERGIKNWFISYGTLLGIVREKSCIDGDDDIDICLDFKEKQSAQSALDELDGKWMKVQKDKDPNTFMRREHSKKFAPIDIYICQVNEAGDFYDKWEGVTWLNCLELEEIEWRDVTLKAPKNYMDKIKKRYGDTWNKRVKRGSAAGDGYRKHKTL